MAKVRAVSVHFCPKCNANKTEEQIQTPCWPEMAEYGPVVLGRFVCECGKHLGEPFMVDSGGLIPPKKE